MIDQIRILDPACDRSVTTSGTRSVPRAGLIPADLASRVSTSPHDQRPDKRGPVGPATPSTPKRARPACAVMRLSKLHAAAAGRRYRRARRHAIVKFARRHSGPTLVPDHASGSVAMSRRDHDASRLGGDARGEVQPIARPSLVAGPHRGPAYPAADILGVAARLGARPAGFVALARG